MRLAVRVGRSPGGRGTRALRTRAAAFTLLALACALVLAACVGAPPPRRTVVVLVDETGSFADLWPAAIEDIADIVVPSLQADEQFVLIGIDDRGFEDRDVRLGLVQLSANNLYAVTQKRSLVAHVRRLQPRAGAAPGSDIAEALMHAAHFLRRGAAAGYRPVLLVFSDMVPDFTRPRNVGEARELGADLDLPPETAVRFFYVRERESRNWAHTVRLWLAVFEAAGVTLSQEHFYLPAESRVALQQTMR